MFLESAIILMLLSSPAMAGKASSCTDVSDFEGDFERSDVQSSDVDYKTSNSLRGIPTSCGPFAQFRIWRTYKAIKFRSDRQFWHRGPDPEYDDKIDSNLAMAHVGGGEYNLIPDAADAAHSYFVKTRVRKGLIETRSSDERWAQTDDYHAALEFHCEPDGRRVLWVKYANESQWCEYVRKSRDDFSANGEKRVEFVSNEMTRIARLLLAKSEAELEAFCSEMRRDKWRSGSSNFQETCASKAGNEIRQRIESVFQLALTQLEKQKKGIRNPEKTYGPTFSSDRFYRKKSGRAVFGGYDPVGLYWEGLRRRLTPERCKGQGYERSSCELFSAINTADVIEYHL